MERKIESTTISRHGSTINIYAVENPIVKLENLYQHVSYEVTYKFGASGEETFVGKYIDCSPGMRSLIFVHPTKGEGRTIMVPTNNILVLRHLFNK